MGGSAFEWSNGHGVVIRASIVEGPMVNRHSRKVCLLVQNMWENLACERSADSVGLRMLAEDRRLL